MPEVKLQKPPPVFGHCDIGNVGFPGLTLWRLWAYVTQHSCRGVRTTSLLAWCLHLVQAAVSQNCFHGALDSLALNQNEKKLSKFVA